VQTWRAALWSWYAFQQKQDMKMVPPRLNPMIVTEPTSGAIEVTTLPHLSPSPAANAAADTHSDSPPTPSDVDMDIANAILGAFARLKDSKGKANQKKPLDFYDNLYKIGKTFAVSCVHL
jgi:hypothetical protein